MAHLLKSLAVLTSLVAAQAFAQTPNEMAVAQARFKSEMADCAALYSVAGKSTCMTEARNSWADFRRGRMNESWKTADFEKNATQRCNVFEGDDKSYCFARVRGQGRIDGSVASGGILRELTVRSTATVAAQNAQAEAARVPDGPPPSGLMSNCRWVPPSDWVCK